MRLAVIGTGAMGLPIAARLVALGHAVTARDIDPARAALARAAGCALAASPAQAADGADAVLVVVVDAAQVHAVLHGDGGLLRAPFCCARPSARPTSRRPRRRWPRRASTPSTPRCPAALRAPPTAR
jgi:3-hydroxyisobutyrate dehydrogenase-like beta-hydroxyacid dehydrogenase